MRVNEFSVDIAKGTETGEGYVSMKHNTKYALSLGNHGHRRCDALVSIDGKSIGGFRIGAYETIEIERPVDDDGCFTFYRAGSKKGDKAGLGSVSKSDMGLITVEFRPEKKRKPKRISGAGGQSILRSASLSSYSTPVRDSVELTSRGIDLKAGGTGLSGKSDQSFYTVEDLKFDKKEVVTINLRLVEGKSKSEPRELAPKSNSIPSPVN